MDSPFFGWELLYAIIEDNIRCPSDIVVAFVHWQMIKFSFSCLGNGDERSIQKEDIGDECLPESWNCEPNHYSLRYVLGTEVYILTCVVLDECTCLFNLYNASKGTVSNISLELREIITTSSQCQQGKKITDMIPKAEMLMVRVNQELIHPVAGCSACSTDTPNRRPDPVVPPRQTNDQRCIPGDQLTSRGGQPNNNWGINYGPPIDMGRNPCCTSPPPQQQQQQLNCHMQTPQRCINPNTCSHDTPKEQPPPMSCNQSQQPMMQPKQQQQMTCRNQDPPQMTQQQYSSSGSNCQEKRVKWAGSERAIQGVSEWDEQKKCTEIGRETSDAQNNDNEGEDRIEIIWAVVEKTI